MNTVTLRAPNYIGYSSLEAWAAGVDPAREVYALPAIDTTTGDRGLRTEHLRIWCAQLDSAGDVHYFRMTLGAVTYLMDQPLDSNAADKERIRDEAWERVRSWLKLSGLDVREALVATPPAERLRYLDGWPEFLTYDRATRRFQVKEA